MTSRVVNVSDQLFNDNVTSNTMMDKSESYYWIFLSIAASVVVYFAIPFVFRFSPLVQRHAVFMHLFSFSRHRRNFYDPKVHQVEGGRNFYLNSVNKGIRIGLWHLLPKSLIKISKEKSDEYWEEALQNSGKPIFVYFHGNGGTRVTSHRIEIYKIFQELDCHVISFDYRGYADSTPVQPNETGVVDDGLTVYNWVRRTLGTNSRTPVFFWGHSLGTGVSTHLTSKLSLEGERSNLPTGLILEAPFSNMKDELRGIYINAVYRFWPGFDWFYGTDLKKNGIAFESDMHIRNVDIPILIFHDIRDMIVPYKLGKKLYETALKSRSKTAKPIQFKKLSEFNIIDAHVYICRFPKLPGMITEFMKSSIKNEWPASA